MNKTTSPVAKRCPHCNGTMVPIVYGEPSLEIFQKYEKGEIVLGGCCIEVNADGKDKMPQWECLKCHRRL